jgi:hypothetical protein
LASFGVVSVYHQPILHPDSLFPTHAILLSICLLFLFLSFISPVQPVLLAGDSMGTIVKAGMGKKRAVD